MESIDGVSLSSSTLKMAILDSLGFRVYFQVILKVWLENVVFKFA